jgi:hypothetical protein
MLARIDQINADIPEVEAQIETHLALSLGRWPDSMRSPGSAPPPPT